MNNKNSSVFVVEHHIQLDICDNQTALLQKNSKLKKTTSCHAAANGTSQQRCYMATFKGNCRCFQKSTRAYTWCLFHIHPFSSILTPFVKPILHRNSLRLQTQGGQTLQRLFTASRLISYTFPYLSLPYTPKNTWPPVAVRYSCLGMLFLAWHFGFDPGSHLVNGQTTKSLGKKWGNNHRTSRSLGRILCLYMYRYYNHYNLIIYIP